MPKDFHPIVERRHFELTLAHDIKPLFGAADEELSTYHREGMFDYGPRFAQVVAEVQAAARVSEAVPKSTVLLRGASPFLFSSCSYLSVFLSPLTRLRSGRGGVGTVLLVVACVCLYKSARPCAERGGTDRQAP